MKVIPYNFNEIPSELRNMPNWILWKAEEKENGKITKIPYQANPQYEGVEARSNDASTWSSFHTAVKYYNNSIADGVGFVFSRRDSYIGIDIDKCVTYKSDDEKRVNPIINEFAQSIINELDSYTEFSVSGTGIHIIIKGDLPQSICGTGRKSTKHNLEIYQHGRYFTMTGNKENSNYRIEDRTDEIAEIIEKYFDDSDLKNRVINISEYEKDHFSNASNEQLWEKMFRSKKGDEIRALYDGHLIDDDHSSSDISLCNHLAFFTGKSSIRMDSMFRETSLYRAKWDRITYGDTGETYGERTIAKAIASTTTTVLEHKHEQEYAEFSFDLPHGDVAVEDGPSGEKKKFRLTELGNAERIAHEYGHVIKYVSDMGWVLWDGKRWKVDEKKEIYRIAAKVVRGLYKSEDEAEQKWAKQCEKLNVMRNSLTFLMSLVPAVRSEFDNHKYLLNVENGIIDLKTGQLQQHDRELKLTKFANVEFVEGAKCPTWMNFLDQIFQGDKELIEYMQRLIGYSLTGEISEQIMIFLIGGGSNGKSTFINTIKDLLGEYGKQAKSDTFIKKKETGANNDIARLVGSRFVSAIESEDGEQLSEAFVKQITGGEPVLARFLRQEYFEFIPEFKVFFTTNHKPVIKGVDEGIWRRVKLVPFNLQLPKEKRDLKLPEKLSFEMPGILNWAIDGCLKWQQSGLVEPDIVKKSTGDYKEDMDILGPFLFERCYVGPNQQIIAKDLFEVYSSWCYANGEFALKNRAFYRALETKGFKKERGAGNKFFIKGVTLQERKVSGIQEKISIPDENEPKNSKSNFFVTS